MRSDPNVGSGLDAAGAALFDSGARDSDLSEGSGVGGLFAPAAAAAAAAPLMAGSWGPCSGIAGAGAGGGAGALDR